MDETSLFRAWQDKPSPETLLGLLEALGGSVYPLCFRVLRHHQDAEDAAQKVLLEFLGILRTLPSLDRMRAWIYRASLLTALSLKRAQRRRMRHERTPRPQPGPLLTEEEGDLIHRHVADLEEDLRRVVVERYFEGNTLAELSAKAHCTTGSIWKKLEKAQGELRRSLARAGLSGAALSLLSTFLETREADAARTTGLPQAVIERARELASGVPPAAAGSFLLKCAAGAAIAVASVLGFVAYHHRDAPETTTSASALRPPSAFAGSSLPRRLPDKPAAIPQEAATETLFDRLVRLRAALEVNVPKGSLGGYIREHEVLHPLVLQDPDTYLTFLRMPESGTYFSMFLDLMMYPGSIGPDSPLPDLPRRISKSLAELLLSGTKEQKLVILDRSSQMIRTFRHQTVAEDFVPPCDQLVTGPDDDLRTQALLFLSAHGHEDRLDLVQSVWRKSTKYRSRMACISILARSKAAAAGELLHQFLEQLLREQDPRWMGAIPTILRDRLQESRTTEDQDRCIRHLVFCLQHESRVEEYERPLLVLTFLPVARMEPILRDLFGHAPSDAINDRISRTLALIDRGETRPELLSQMLLFGPAPATPPPPSPEPPAEAQQAAPDETARPPQAEGPVPDAFEVLSKDRKLKAIVRKGRDGFASEFEIWDLEKDNRLLRGFNAAQVTAFAFSQDGRRYAMADRAGDVIVCGMNGSGSKSFRSQILVRSLSFSKDGRTLLAPSESWAVPGR